MLALRLARGCGPAVQARRLLVVLASGGTGLLLLCALGYAMGHPHGQGHAALRLAWCLVPLAATVSCAAAVARHDPAARPSPGVFAVGLGPARIMVLAALTTFFTCLTGSLLALLLFLHLRGDASGLPFDGAADGLLAAGRPLPVGALLLLLALVPLTASATCALVLRPTRGDGSAGALDDADAPPAAASRPGGLPWGVALLAVGLAVETYAGGTKGDRHDLPLPGRLVGSSAGVLAGWSVSALGLALAGPALTFFCGRLLQSGRPGGLRLLAGRILQQESRRVGRPLGVVCAVASGTYAAVTLSAQDQPGAGPLTLLGGVIVACCTLATLLMAAAQARRSRGRTRVALRRIGAPDSLLRAAAALRAGALLALFTPLTWVVAQLAALPLEG